MRLDVRYLGTSGLTAAKGGGEALSFAPNLTREKVFFDADLLQPLRFREAMSALHEVVVGDARFKKRDKSAYLAWKADRAAEEVELRRQLMDRAVAKELAKKKAAPLPADLDEQFRKMHRLYWEKRVFWANELSRNDPELFRALVPCDPVVTVAPDVVFFECFSKDESAYGCLQVARDAFRDAGESGVGTTNVDYSLSLYDHFQSLRSYRRTRLLVDPSGFEVQTVGHSDVREEKIDLPPSWLRGFGQLQAAMALPSRRVSLSTDVVYSLLAFLKRNREKEGPRALRFELTPGRPAQVVLEPWGVNLVSRGAPFDGPKPETIKVWGRRRLFALARLLPLTTSVDVYLFGSGLPSIWVANLGEMRFTLGLSGWTTNDWTSGSNLDLHFAEQKPDFALVDAVARRLERSRSASATELATELRAPAAAMRAALFALARRGQLVFDFASGLVRYRPILPVALGEALMGDEPPELRESRQLVRGLKLARVEAIGEGTLATARFGTMDVELLLDRDGAVKRGSCSCSHHFKNGLRRGPCRHLLAIRSTLLATRRDDVLRPWVAPDVGEASDAGAAPRDADLVPTIVYLTDACARTLEELASSRVEGLESVLARAWKIARPEVAALKEAPTLPELASTRPISLSLPSALAAEVHAEETRLRAPFPPGRLLGWAAWQVRHALKLSSSVQLG